LSRRFAQISFELKGIDGERIEGRRALFHARSSGISKARMELLKYDIPRPGRYVLRMTGLGAPQANDVNHAILFASRTWHDPWVTCWESSWRPGF